MPSPHCEIKFDNNPQGIYHAGQTLSGSVILKLDEPKRVNDFKLAVNGCAEVKWTKRKSRYHITTYKGEEQLLRSEKSLIPRYDADAIEIPAGTHIYKFACALPSSLATSFEGEHGFIRYTVSAILDRPWKFNQICKVAFTVLKTLDLNLQIPLKYPIKCKEIKTFCCWPCKSQPLYMTVRIPTSGFVPGQKIPITTILDNTSNVNVHRINCKLERLESFISQEPREKTKTITKTLAFVSNVITDESSERCTLYLKIPSVAPTGKCSVLTIKYQLIVEIIVDIFHYNPKITIPVTIGTVPFHQPVPAVDIPSGQLEDEGRFGNSSKVLPVALTEENSTTPPPSYEEAVHGLAVQVNDDPNAIGSHHNAPRYPVYKMEWDL